MCIARVIREQTLEMILGLTLAALVILVNHAASGSLKIPVSTVGPVLMSSTDFPHLRMALLCPITPILLLPLWMLRKCF
jgi:hypothetical protein